MTVAMLLSQSRAAHAGSFQHRGRIDSRGAVSHSPQLQRVGQQIQTALSLRLEAHALDPEHLDPAWLDDASAMNGVSHEAMVAFLGRYLMPTEKRE